MTAKVSVSLSDSDIAYIDHLAESQSGNRSAVIHDLVRISRELRAEDAYAAAAMEWSASGEADAWDGVADDALTE